MKLLRLVATVYNTVKFIRGIKNTARSPKGNSSSLFPVPYMSRPTDLLPSDCYFIFNFVKNLLMSPYLYSSSSCIKVRKS
jgi:hypothetical protein